MFNAEKSTTPKAIYTNNHLGCTLNENSAISAPTIVSKLKRLAEIAQFANDILKSDLFLKTLKIAVDK